MAGRVTSGGMPDLVSPMQVSAGSGLSPTGPDWVVELAWTGHRCVAYVEPRRRTRLLSANAVSMTAAYPELGPPLERRSPPLGMVLDGTLVARGEEHAPRARLLQRRRGRMRPTEAHIRDVPVDFQVADLLWLDGHSTVDLPYRDRRALLEQLGFDTAPVWTTSPLPVSEMGTMLRIADAKGVDALHARHVGSRYRPGGRSPLWVRVPVPRTRQVVIGGWTPTDVGRPDAIASLLLGVPDGDRLRYVGRVGVAGDQRRQVAGLMHLRAGHSPFAGAVPPDAARHAIWVAPRLVGLVEFTGFVAAGRLRLPLWRGLAQSTDTSAEFAAELLASSTGVGTATGGTVARWARPAEPPPERASPEPAPVAAEHVPEPGSSGPQQADEGPLDDEPVVLRSEQEVPLETAPGQEHEHAGVPVEVRRLEQHFVYNALNTIAALIRTDPGRARELLFGFADLSRAADVPGDTLSTLGAELDAVRGYLELERARFGKRLRVEIHVDAALHDMPVEPMRVLSVVRAAVQRDIEPRPQGGVLTVAARVIGGGCEVHVVGGAGDPVVLELGAVAPR